MNIGFIGSGGITKAVVTGLCRSSLNVESIALSPRNAETAAELARLDDRVRVCESNQRVLDACDVACIAVLPGVATDVLHALAFRPEHTVISFVAGLTIEQLARCIGAGARIVRAIPLPATAHGFGSTVIHPPNEHAAALFSAVGAAVEVSEERQFDAFSAATATMSTYYTFVEAQAKWLVKEGVPYDRARAFCRVITGLAQMAQLGHDSFADLAMQCTTEGGINALMHSKLESEGFLRRSAAR